MFKSILASTLIVLTIQTSFAQEMSEFERGFLAGKSSCANLAKPQRKLIASNCRCDGGALMRIMKFSDGTQEIIQLGSYRSEAYNTFLDTSCEEAKEENNVCSPVVNIIQQ